MLMKSHTGIETQISYRLTHIFAAFSAFRVQFRCNFVANSVFFGVILCNSVANNAINCLNHPCHSPIRVIGDFYSLILVTLYRQGFYHDH